MDVKEIDNLNSALAFLRQCSTDIPLLLLFSGEGESLILAKWLKRHTYNFVGVFCVTRYGIFWEVERAATRRWAEIMGGGNPLLILEVQNEDPTTLFYFGHNFSILGEKAYYNANPNINKFARDKDFRNIVMGFRRDDIFRHFYRKDDIKRITKTFDREIAQSGKVPTETSRTIWFPFYDMKQDLKEFCAR